MHRFCYLPSLKDNLVNEEKKYMKLIQKVDHFINIQSLYYK